MIHGTKTRYFCAPGPEDQAAADRPHPLPQRTVQAQTHGSAMRLRLSISSAE